MNDNIERRGLLIILSSPSGAGKTSISKALIEQDDNIQLSVSSTTRPPRPNEVEGVDYFFESHASFEEKMAQNQFIEYAQVYDNYYGTPKAPVDHALSQGRDVLFDIDWQGTQQLSQHYIYDLVRIFILPPSLQALRERLTGRNSDSEEVINQRMAKASDEMSHWAEYEYILINDKLDMTIKAVQSIVQAERMKRRRMIDISGFVNSVRYEPS